MLTVRQNPRAGPSGRSKCFGTRAAATARPLVFKDRRGPRVTCPQGKGAMPRLPSNASQRKCSAHTRGEGQASRMCSRVAHPLVPFARGASDPGRSDLGRQLVTPKSPCGLRGAAPVGRFKTLLRKEAVVPPSPCSPLRSLAEAPGTALASPARATVSGGLPGPLPTERPVAFLFIPRQFDFLGWASEKSTTSSR